jgi:hydrogenase expression/formation protein HypD
MSKKTAAVSPGTQTPSRVVVADQLKRLHAAAVAIGRPVSLMEVCGTHTMSAFRSGLHSLLPDNVKLLSGPGCPVCVTAQSDIDLLIDLARRPGVTLCSYGDMLRVPGRGGSLERARAEGADIRVIYSTLDAVKIAEETPGRDVVLAAVGFETTAPATAAAVLAAEARGLKNFLVYASHKQVVPAMTALLEAGDVKVDGFLLPGHVSVVIGVDVYRPIVEKYRLPCVVSGFEELHMAGAILHLVEQIRDGKAELFNDYPEAVGAGGNVRALAMIDRVFETADVRWRAMGTIRQSGLAMRKAYAGFDAVARFGLALPEEHEVPGCLCGRVITGAVTPHECRLFGRLCTPVNPIGPCMVSSEGTCQAYFKYARVAGRFSGSFVEGAKSGKKKEVGVVA